MFTSPYISELHVILSFTFAFKFHACFSATSQNEFEMFKKKALSGGIIPKCNGMITGPFQFLYLSCFKLWHCIFISIHDVLNIFKTVEIKGGFSKRQGKKFSRCENSTKFRLEYTNNFQRHHCFNKYQSFRFHTGFIIIGQP